MELSAAGRQVVVEAPEALDRVASVAVNLWSTIDDPDLVRGFGFSTGADAPTLTEVPWDVPTHRPSAYPEEGQDDL